MKLIILFFLTLIFSCDNLTGNSEELQPNNGIVGEWMLVSLAEYQFVNDSMFLDTVKVYPIDSIASGTYLTEMYTNDSCFSMGYSKGEYQGKIPFTYKTVGDSLYKYSTVKDSFLGYEYSIENDTLQTILNSEFVSRKTIKIHKFVKID